MKKVVLKVELHDEKTKQKAMKTASSLSGVESISLELKDKQMTISGEIDPVCAVSKLRKCCYTEIVTVEPAKEGKEKEKEKKVMPSRVHFSLYEDNPLIYYQMRPPALPYYVTCYEENPSACVIC